MPSQVFYLAAWAFLGIGMRMTLYDAAFPALVPWTVELSVALVVILAILGLFKPKDSATV